MNMIKQSIRKWIGNSQIGRKPILCGMIGLLALASVFTTLLDTPADGDRFVSWSAAGDDGAVTVSLYYSNQEELREAKTFQVQFLLSPQGEETIQEEDVEFVFDAGIADDDEISVKEWRYNEDGKALTVYVSGRGKAPLKQGEILKLGTLKITCENDVEVSVNRVGCLVVGEDFTKDQVMYFGNMESCTVKGNAGESESSGESETPGESENPGESETPSETETPGESENPGESETPSESQTPDESETPSEPETPGESQTPGESETPGESKPSTRPSLPDDTDRDEDEDDDTYERQDPRETEGSWISKGTEWTFKKKDGSSVQNEWILVGGKWYRFDNNGKMETGWVSQEGVWYFCDASGAMQTGWVWSDGNWYLCGPSGAMKTGWVQDKGIWYYLKENGAMQTGWVLSGDRWYYMDADGKMLTNTTTPDGRWVDKNGVRVE